MTDTRKWKYAMKNMSKCDIMHHRYSVPGYTGDQKVCVHLTSTVQKTGAQRLFDHPV